MRCGMPPRSCGGGSPELQSPLRDLTQFKSFLGLDFFARVLRGADLFFVLT